LAGPPQKQCSRCEKGGRSRRDFAAALAPDLGASPETTRDRGTQAGASPPSAGAAAAPLSRPRNSFGDTQPPALAAALGADGKSIIFWVPPRPGRQCAKPVELPVLRQRLSWNYSGYEAVAAGARALLLDRRRCLPDHDLCSHARFVQTNCASPLLVEGSTREEEFGPRGTAGRPDFRP